MRINSTTRRIRIKTNGVLEIVFPQWLVERKLNCLYVSLKSLLRNLGCFLDNLILRIRQRFVALLEDLVGEPSVNILERCKWSTVIELTCCPGSIHNFAERSTFIYLDDSSCDLDVAFFAVALRVE